MLPKLRQETEGFNGSAIVWRKGKGISQSPFLHNEPVLLLTHTAIEFKACVFPYIFRSLIACIWTLADLHAFNALQMVKRMRYLLHKTLKQWSQQATPRPFDSFPLSSSRLPDELKAPVCILLRYCIHLYCILIILHDLILSYLEELLNFLFV